LKVFFFKEVQPHQT